MTTRRSRKAGLTIAIAACLGWSGVALGQADSLLRQRQAESQAVEDYLKSLQLDGLVIEHLEVETSRELDREARQQMAARLINEYAERMMTGGLADSDWKSKAELLLQTYPDLATPSIRIAILQAKYRIGEDAFRKWWETGRDRKLRRELVRRWFVLKAELETLNLQLNADYEDQVALLQATPDNNDSQSRQLTRLDGWLLHTDYLIGWSSYFLGILTPQNRRQLMLTADAHFRTFLQIEPKRTLTEVSPEWFDFSSDWNARALIGLAMCQRGLNHPLQSQYCFELIENHATSQLTRELRFVWDLNSRVYLDEVSAALEIVDSMEEARHISESGRTAFWMATLNASIATRYRAEVISQRLLRAGLTGLARQFDAPRIEAFLRENRIKIEGDDFLRFWIAGYLDFYEAETSNVAKKYDDAKAKLTAALAIADEKTNPLDVARCRFLLARVQFQNRDYETASRVFLECSKSLEVIAPELSAESMWLAVRSLSEHSRTHSRSLIQANRAIDQLMRRFPGSTFAKRAEFERLRLNVANLETEKAIDRLNRIEPTDLNYPLAANEIVKIRYQSWLDAHRAKSESESQKFEALLDAESKFEKLETASDASKLKSQLLVIDAMLKTESIDIETIRQGMDQMQRRAEAAGSGKPVYQEYRYYRFLLANRSADEPQAMAEVQWLSENAKGTLFEKSAMIELAQLVDQRLASQTNPPQEELARATTIFTKLVGLLGSSENELKQSPNARVAYARLAALKLAGGSTDEAIEMLVSLNALFPDHKSYLRQLASTYTQSQHYAEATSIWQKLVRGVDPGSDLWLESKYNLAFCLYHVGKRAEARTLHEQTRRLSPALPESWVKRFDDLSALLIEESTPSR